MLISHAGYTRQAGMQSPVSRAKVLVSHQNTENTCVSRNSGSLTADMLLKNSFSIFLLIAMTADLIGGRPTHRRPHRRQQRSHHHSHDEEEEARIEDETHDNLQLIRDIIQMVGFNLTFGRDGLRVHLGSRSNAPFPHTEAKSMDYGSSASDEQSRPVVHLTPANKSKILIAGRPFLLLPMPDDYALLPLPSKQTADVTRKGVRDGKTPLFGQPVTSAAVTQASDFVYPTLLTPNPVTDSVRDFDTDAATMLD